VNLNQLVLEYQQSGEGLSRILREIAPRIYSYPLSKPGFGEDDCGEYYLFVYPRLLRTLRRFQDRGKPFEWYLNSVLCWQLKEYRCHRYRCEEGWGAAAHPGFWERAGLPPGGNRGCPAPDPVPGPAPTAPDLAAWLPRVCRGRLSRAAGRRLLFWALKDPRRLAPADLEMLAGASGVPAGALEAAVQEIERALLAKEERLHRLYLRRNRSYALCLRLQRRLARELDPERRAEGLLRLERARSDLHTALARLSAVRLAASNREIALALSIPKGTVDSSLYWLRLRLAELREERSA
jgi:hypothetical protein